MPLVSDDLLRKGQTRRETTQPNNSFLLLTEFAAQRLVNKNPKKYQALKEQLVAFLKERMALEYELYEFLKQRLHLQHRSLEAVLARPTTPLPTKPTEPPRWGVWDRVNNDLARAS